MPTAIKDPTPQWLTDPSVTDSQMTKLLRALAVLIGATDPTSQIMGVAGTHVPGEGPSLAQKLTGIKAYHGSPHDFDAFDASKIGTGEGAQAYGHGLYFAENPNVARDYKNRLSGDFKVGDQPAKDAYAAAAQLNDVSRGGSGKWDESAVGALEAIEAWQKTGSPWTGGHPPTEAERAFFQRTPQLRGYLNAADQIEKGIVAKGSGRMYEVNIKADPDQFLDWDKPLSQQPEPVRYVLGHKGRPSETEVDAMFALAKKRGVDPATMPEYKALQARMDEAAQLERDYPSGREIYNQFMNDERDVAIRQGRNADSTLPRAQDAASRQLHEMGIPGIKYLDQGSRAAGEGSRNYVVFDPKIIEIARKYGVSLLVAKTLYEQSQKPTPNVRKWY